jgi:hypothetical protein
VRQTVKVFRARNWLGLFLVQLLYDIREPHHYFMDTFEIIKIA